MSAHAANFADYATAEGLCDWAAAAVGYGEGECGDGEVGCHMEVLRYCGAVLELSLIHI